MSQDQQTYSRAAHAAMAGLIVQVFLGIVVGLLGAYAGSPALSAATWYLFGGAPIWLVLLVLYHQHRLERAEALEAEQLARTDATAAALFEEAGQQLQLARQRLDNLYKYILPTISVIVSVYLLAVGGTLLYVNAESYQAGMLAGLHEYASPGGVGLIALVAGFVAFLVSRYVAGMTQVREWQLLSGGAAYLMGNAVAVIAIAVGAGIALFGSDVVLVWMALILPMIMLLLGTEILLTFVLDIYRPRRANEVVRPAFSSRLLGWMTRPESLGRIVTETLNYQFGFEVSSSWFYRLLARAITPLIAVGLLVLILMTSLVFVAPQQQAVVTRFGALSRTIEPGVWLKWPWPIGRVQKFDAYQVHQLVVGSKYEPTPARMFILWTNEHTHGEPEQYLLTAPTRIDDLGLEVDSPVGELVGAEVAINFRVSDLEKFARNAPNPHRLFEAQRQQERWDTGRRREGERRIDPSPILTSLAERRVTRFFATRNVDELLTQNRLETGRLLRQQIQADLDERELGIELVFVGVVGIHPPQEGEVAAKFHEQIGVLQQNQIAIEQAQRDAIATLAAVAGSDWRAWQIDVAITELESLRRQIRGGGDPQQREELERLMAEKEVEIERLMDQAGGRAAQIIHEARSYRWTHSLGELARADRARSQYAAYLNAPRYYLMREYLDALSAGLNERRKYVFVTDQPVPPMIRLNLEEQQTGLDSLFDRD